MTRERISAPTPIDVLHPDGMAARVRVLGSACPDYVRPSRSAQGGEEPQSLDALLVVPDEADCSTTGWLERAADTAERCLAANAIGFAVVPRRWRSTFVRYARARGLQVEPFVHARHAESNHYLVPCDAGVARYVLSTVPMSRSNRRAWRMAWAAPMAEAMIPTLAPDVALIVRRPGARPLLEWAHASTRSAVHCTNALIRVKTEPEMATALVALFQRGDDRPAVHLKVPLSRPSSAARLKEGLALSGVGRSAESAGAALPQWELHETPSGLWMLSMSALAGECAAAVLPVAPGRLTSVVDRLATWIDRWAFSTARAAPAGPSRFERHILTPGATVAAHLTDGDAYLRRLRAMCARSQGTPVPYVAIHGDLTMSNVLLQRDDAIGIVDWESARDDGLPLTDFFYAAADALAATQRYRDRTGAFVSCFDPNTTFGHWMSQATARQAAAIDLPEHTIGLLKHATVLYHAANEQRMARLDRPFLQIAQRLCTELVAEGAAA